MNHRTRPTLDLQPASTRTGGDCTDRNRCLHHMRGSDGAEQPFGADPMEAGGDRAAALMAIRLPAAEARLRLVRRSAE